MLIYHLHQAYEDRWVLDAERGSVKRREAVLKPSGTSAISIPAGQFESTPEGAVFEVGSDGSFDVPEDVAEYFIGMPGWGEGVCPFPADDPAPAKSTRSRAKAAE